MRDECQLQCCDVRVKHPDKYQGGTVASRNSPQVLGQALPACYITLCIPTGLSATVE